MEYAKRKKELLESLIKKEEDASISKMLSGDSILSKEDQQLEDEANKLIAEILSKAKYTSFLKRS